MIYMLCCTVFACAVLCMTTFSPRFYRARSPLVFSGAGLPGVAIAHGPMVSNIMMRDFAAEFGAEFHSASNSYQQQ